MEAIGNLLHTVGEKVGLVHDEKKDQQLPPGAAAGAAPSASSAAYAEWQRNNQQEKNSGGGGGILASIGEVAKAALSPPPLDGDPADVETIVPVRCFVHVDLFLMLLFLRSLEQILTNIHHRLFSEIFCRQWSTRSKKPCRNSCQSSSSLLRNRRRRRRRSKLASHLLELCLIRRTRQRRRASANSKQLRRLADRWLQGGTPPWSR